MIQPISSTNMYRNAFKGYYDPTCVSIPASMRDKIMHQPDTWDKLKNIVKNVFQAKDGNNIISQDGTALTHVLPSGDSYMFGLASKSDLQEAADGVKEAFGIGIKPINGSNFASDSGFIHILPDGSPVTIDFEATADAHSAIDSVWSGLKKAEEMGVQDKLLALADSETIPNGLEHTSSLKEMFDALTDMLDLF